MSYKLRRTSMQYIKGTGTVPPDDWENHIVILWEEDDARPEDRERITSAWKKITGHDKKWRGDAIAIVDRGDWGARLYSNGYVDIYSCEGEALGILAEIFE